jgi:hypothetical protein
LLRKALEVAADELRGQEDASHEAHRADPPDQPHEPVAARNADALALLAESFLEHGSAARAAGDRHLVIVHVDERVLRAGEIEANETNNAASSRKSAACIRKLFAGYVAMAV